MPAVGGVARRATRIAQERQANRYVLVLDAGDSLMGDQNPARKTAGKSSVEAMNRLGYDAVALGPQDLSVGLAVLRERIAEAKFAFLAANVTVAATGDLLTRPYVVREVAGHRVAVIGLTRGKGTGELTVGDPLAAAQKAVSEVRSRADVVIILSHAGQATDRQLAETLPGVAAVVSGGPGAQGAAWVGRSGVPVFHADEATVGHAGRYLGIARLSFDAAGRLTSQSWQRVALGPEIASDPDMAAWAQGQVD